VCVWVCVCVCVCVFVLAADAQTYKYVCRRRWRTAAVPTLYGKVEFPYRASGARVNGLFLSRRRCRIRRRFSCRKK